MKERSKNVAGMKGRIKRKKGDGDEDLKQMTFPMRLKMLMH
jgi:hypothetical protein